MSTGEQRQILILEDDGSIALDLTHLLEDHGYRVVGPARTCLDALALLKARKVDAAILDFLLGDENCEAVADELDCRGIPWALCTILRRRELPARYRTVQRVAKPYTSGELLRVVRNLRPTSRLDAVI